MINRLKSLLCIILLSVSTQNLPTIGHRSSTQSKRTEGRGSAFSISEVASSLWVTAGVIFGGFVVWKISSVENDVKKQRKEIRKQGKKIRALKKHVTKQDKANEAIAQQFKRNIAELRKDTGNIREDMAHDIKALSSDIAELNNYKTSIGLNKEMAEFKRDMRNRWNKLLKIDRDTIGRLIKLGAGEDYTEGLSSHTASTSSSGSSSPTESL